MPRENQYEHFGCVLPVFVGVCVCARMYICTYMCLCVCVCVDRYLCAHMYICVYVCVRAYVCNVYICAHVWRGQGSAGDPSRGIRFGKAIALEGAIEQDPWA